MTTEHSCDTFEGSAPSTANYAGLQGSHCKGCGNCCSWPNRCSHCGKCRNCGQHIAPLEFQPYWPTYTQPIWTNGAPIPAAQPQWISTIGGTTTTLASLGTYPRTRGPHT